MPDMTHIPHLGRIAADDVGAIQQKEATYQGSWKAAGGRSAWFMLRRKMDRLMVMMQRPEPPEGFDLRIAALGINASVEGLKLSEGQVEALAHVTDAYCTEDIFQMIANNPSGDDGSPLAEVRDLRRYLLLVEAEMVARGVVSRAPVQTLKKAMHACSYGPGSPPVEPPAPAPTVAEERRVPRYASPAAAPAFGVPGTPENGGQHARYRLEDGLTVSPGDPWYFTSTDPIGGNIYWNVWRPDCPPDMTEHLPRLRLELNHKEWEETPAEYRGMYNWLGAETKYRLRKPFQEAWCETG